MRRSIADFVVVRMVMVIFSGIVHFLLASRLLVVVFCLHLNWLCRVLLEVLRRSVETPGSTGVVFSCRSGRSPDGSAC